MGRDGDWVVTVAGEKVSKAEYIVMMQVQRDKLLAENNILDDNAKKTFWKTKIDGKLPEDIVKERTLDKIKELKIQFIKAREENIVSDKSDEDSAKSYVDDLKTSLSLLHLTSLYWRRNSYKNTASRASNTRPHMLRPRWREST